MGGVVVDWEWLWLVIDDVLYVFGECDCEVVLL